MGSPLLVALLTTSITIVARQVVSLASFEISKKLLILFVALSQTYVLSNLLLEILEIVPRAVPFFSTTISCVGFVNKIVLTLAPM